MFSYPNPASSSDSTLAGDDDDSHSYDLLPTYTSLPRTPAASSPEVLANRVLGPRHLSTILSNPQLLSNFADFLTARSESGLKALVHYLDAQKALKALAYANAIVAGLEPVEGVAGPPEMASTPLKLCRDRAFGCLLEELTGYVTHSMVEVVSQQVARRIMGNEVVTRGADGETAEVADGLGESFCLTDPRREGNPVIFMSEEFNRMTQYGVAYAVGRNCRFLQGPQTDRKTVLRLKLAIEAQKETSELFLNYRRDGSPFFNLLMVAPLFDSQGHLKYYVGAQVDVTRLISDGIGMESLRELDRREQSQDDDGEAETDVFKDLAELFNDAEIETTKAFAGRLHNGRRLKREGTARRERTQSVSSRMRVVVNDTTPEEKRSQAASIPRGPDISLLKSVYQNYLLLRPYPSLRILFTSPSLRTPGIHQLHFLSKIGASPRVREELYDALKVGNGVTAKVLWLTNRDASEGRERWVHCTPMLDANGEVGVWMVIVVDPITQQRGRRRREIDITGYPPPPPPHPLQPAGQKKSESEEKVEDEQRNMLKPPGRKPPAPPSLPSSPVQRIVRRDIEVVPRPEELLPPFKLSDHIPPRGSSWGRTASKEKNDIDAFAQRLGMLAAN